MVVAVWASRLVDLGLTIPLWIAQMVVAGSRRGITAPRLLVAVDHLATKAVCRMAEVATEAVPAVMVGMAVTAEPVVGPVVGAGLGVRGQGRLIVGYGGAGMATPVGQAMAVLTIGTASMTMRWMRRCCAIRMRIVRHEVPDLGVSMELVICIMDSVKSH